MVTVDFDRYLRFTTTFLNGIRGGAVTCVPRPGGRTVCYADGIPDQVAIWEIDVDSGERRPLLDVARARRAMEDRFGHPLPFSGLPFSEFTFGDRRTVRAFVPRQPAGLVGPATVRYLDIDLENWLVDIDVESCGVRMVPPAEQQRLRRAVPRNVRKG